jgi:pimeloyl-ACP methyl ester carboxylesterase
MENEMNLPTSDEWASRCTRDGEFQLAKRYWTGGLRLRIGRDEIGLRLEDGVLMEGLPAPGQGVVAFGGDATVWEQVLEASPGRFYNDVMSNVSAGKGLSLEGDQLAHAQYYSAAMRAIELLRPETTDGSPLAHDQGMTGRFDSPVGRYVHLDLQGHDHRIYFEEAGQGIPILLQHTAGCHGSQWRHLFEFPEITDRFRLIAYDLPYHGKSIPPTSKAWWAETYHLQGEFLRSIPLGLSDALALDRPVFMGCSVGGLLALDLALHHPDRFRSVISLEGALHVGGSLEQYGSLWHPQVSNEYKARLMDGLMAPISPTAYRKETSFVYASGWPPAFLGDLYYYLEEYDLRDKARSIDTNAVGVHILSGEYDYSSTLEMGRAAHAAIKGSTFTEMSGVGHFPMSENPQVFVEYLLPILELIAR